ncbi:uncharacterized protein BXZ73DRAFT_50009 [Epithele typhae]|uniref:uncharacterized protein n=1 Tax=Epithele typhae TaxID=378194 RepID=UPI002007EDC5|nr:uncharacterized protein BXZ73DRAFT_50009 [Epithele typhae]KAH9925373.1 hypothetical protein BXZ73DRAFT_50009 [Epithele typhae]
MRCQKSSHRVTSERETLAGLIRALAQPPAIAAQPDQFSRRENKAGILDYRPQNPPPIFIYHTVYARLLAAVNNHDPQLPVDPEELDIAADFIARGRVYGSEEPSALSDVLEEELLCTYHSTPVEAPNGFKPVSVFIRVKPEDDSTDPTAYAECTYIDTYTSLEATDVRKACCCPALLVACTGTSIQVLGAAFADHIIVQPLVDLSLFPLPGADDVIYRVARLFRALRTARGELEKYYADVVSSVASCIPAPALISPHWTEFVHPEHGLVVLQYTGRLGVEHYPSRAVFTAIATMAGAPPVDVVVKFAPQYSKQAHELLAPEFAPRLWHCAEVESVGMWAVVMDFVPGEELDEGEVLTPAQGDALRCAVGRLHAQGLVFGDLRDANVLTVGDGVRLIDFDWCGVVGEARYPADLHMGHAWPMDVRRGGLIQKTHDLYWVEQLTDS